ncbi:methylmalonyl-CoA mutase [Neobacillus piezotolerans]|uniref:Methylmalonyl-CoA mutase n=1 Tax=Neobacillus piezotolerans TaxID=2259171 RepID=A0A3D8GLD7_9BACI|nr:methylmalonyl-CoA mutase family protein [Neobacillus piezotolerans]RDU35208.1 methylmalonyl-CoA mutase [Neobacillus piezotolerans]
MDKIMAYRFSETTMADWKNKAEQALKGKSTDTLNSRTYESIILKPLYTREDCVNAGYPGSPDFRRGINPPGYRDRKWHIAQQISWDSADELSRKLKDAFSKGQTSISFKMKEGFERDAAIASYGFSENHPYAIDAGSGQAAFLSALDEADRTAGLTGYIGFDPLAEFAIRNGDKPLDLGDYAETITGAAVKHTNLRTVLVDAGVYHNGGANAVQELAAAAASGVFYIERLLEAGMDIDSIFTKIVFSFATGANFFMEIAKFRAARIIWDRIGELYGAVEPVRGMVIAAQTSQFTKTLYDPHVNLLRAGNEAFAAVLGGVQYLHVEPFDSLEGATPLSERIARNIQLILQEEAYLDKVADPAGGSWYVEELTEQLAEKAWELFVKIDSLGGMHAVLATGWLKKEIGATLDQRMSDAKTRKQSIVGTNVYANLAETAKAIPEQRDVWEHGIRGTRLSIPFEELRLKTAALEKSGQKASVGLICLGSLKESKARADFVEGFVAPGGIRAGRSGVVVSLDDAEEFIAETGFPRYCFCSTDERYKEDGLGILTELKRRHPGILFYLAGQPGEKDEWLEAGLTDFIHIKSNCHDFLANVIAEMEAAAND